MDIELYKALDIINNNILTLASELAGVRLHLTPLPRNEQQASYSTLQQQAEYNRDNAATLYGDKLVLVCDSCLENMDVALREVYRGCDGSNQLPRYWVERSTGKRVKFSPYGWVADE